MGNHIEAHSNEIGVCTNVCAVVLVCRATPCILLAVSSSRGVRCTLTAEMRQVSYSTHAPRRVATVAVAPVISFTQQYTLQQTDALRLGPKQRQRTLGGGTYGVCPMACALLG